MDGLVKMFEENMVLTKNKLLTLSLKGWERSVRGYRRENILRELRADVMKCFPHVMAVDKRYNVVTFARNFHMGI